VMTRQFAIKQPRGWQPPVETPPHETRIPDREGMFAHGKEQMHTLQQVFRATGGLATLDEVVERFEEHAGPDREILHKWIMARRVIAFEWQGRIWLPMFQFSCHSMSVHHALQPVIRELATVYDGWETANWFAYPNDGLCGRRPVDMLMSDLASVWYAARLESYIATGDEH
jgi:hypothetical protein